jgi:serine/threonine protein kinase
LELPFLSDVEIASVTELQKFMWQLMEAAEFLHRNEICYRDFKRSNVRFNGHSVFLVDFDCAISFKQLESYLEAKREFPRVGTKGYMAPEVEAGQAYGSSADIWSLGILFAEELMRLTDNFFEVNAITQSPIDEVLRICAKRFGEKSDAFDLISHMIVEVPTERLTAEQILSHRYFQNILQDLKKHQHRSVQTDPVIEGYYYIFPPDDSMSYFEATLEQSNQFVPNKKRHQLIY